jgi:hypothetical protein
MSPTWACGLLAVWLLGQTIVYAHCRKSQSGTAWGALSTALDELCSCRWRVNFRDSSIVSVRNWGSAVYRCIKKRGLASPRQAAAVGEPEAGVRWGVEIWSAACRGKGGGTHCRIHGPRHLVAAWHYRRHGRLVAEVCLVRFRIVKQRRPRRPPAWVFYLRVAVLYRGIRTQKR